MYRGIQPGLVRDAGDYVHRYVPYVSILSADAKTDYSWYDSRSSEGMSEE